MRSSGAVIPLEMLEHLISLSDDGHHERLNLVHFDDKEAGSFPAFFVG